MKLSGQQVEAFDRMVEFLTEPSDKPIFVLGGLAGTGKTTILAALCDHLSSERYPFVVGTPTGKAAAVLRRKGVPAATIHSIAYQCAGKDKHGDLQFDFVGVNREEHDEYGQPIEKEPVAALIIDEASMVSQTMLDDLMCAGVKLLFVGDYGQLPPVKGDPKLMERCDVRLTEVHRQMGGLLELCYAVREDRLMGRHFTQDESIARYATNGTPRAAEWQDEADIIIVGSNRTRFEINQFRLGQLGMNVRFGALSKERNELGPQLLELGKQDIAIPMCVMSNNREYDLYNGELGWFVPREDFDGLIGGEWFTDRPCKNDTETIGGEPLTISTMALFTKPGEAPFYADGLLVEFGWAITCHKAQGSEWPHVAVIDTPMQGDADQRRRWRYTAATRAQHRLTWCGDVRR